MFHYANSYTHNFLGKLLSIVSVPEALSTGLLINPIFLYLLTNVLTSLFSAGNLVSSIPSQSLPSFLKEMNNHQRTACLTSGYTNEWSAADSVFHKWNAFHFQVSKFWRWRTTQARMHTLTTGHS